MEIVFITTFHIDNSYADLLFLELKLALSISIKLSFCLGTNVILGIDIFYP